MIPVEFPMIAPLEVSAESAESKTEAPILIPYNVFCNQPEKAVYVRFKDKCPAWELQETCDCILLFRLVGLLTGESDAPFFFRNIKKVPIVGDVVLTCEGEYIKVVSIEWL